MRPMVPTDRAFGRVRIDSNDHSVHPAVIGRRIEIVVDLHRVLALCEGRLVADHERVWA